MQLTFTPLWRGFKLPTLVLILSALIFTQTTYGKLLTSPNDLTALEYDFIIVGAGTAGSVLASRLTEDTKTSVLVVEAGVNNANILDIIVPFLGVAAPGTAVDWNYTTTPQAGLNNKSIPFTRGFVLGGSSSINLMAWTRGSNDVWDNWAKLTRDQGWAWPSVEPYYLKTSRLVPSADGHDTSGQVDPSVHGHGPLEVSLPGFPTELDDRVVNASKSLGGRFSFTKDLNAGKAVGFGYVQSTVGDGMRSSAATAYLEPALRRTNLDVLIMTHVTKLIPNSDGGHAVPVFQTVEISQGPHKPRFQVKASKEIILCGGVVGSPQLLLLSGIGPKDELSQVNISSVVDLPDVGKHLADHALLANYYTVNSNMTFDSVLRNGTVFEEDLNEWTTAREGRFVDTPSNVFGFMRIPNNASVLKHHPNPASGPLSANTEIILINGFASFNGISQPPTGSFMTMLTNLVSPTSRGSITLNSSNPFADPRIDLKLLTTDFDIQVMIQAMKDGEEFIRSKPWVQYILGPFGDLANATTDTARAAFIRNTAATVNHPVGTARMGPKHASWGVVDSDLLVRKTKGLRIVDASIFPQIPECHTQAVVYTVAERAADLIKKANGLH